jgi:hypothetical protein
MTRSIALSLAALIALPALAQEPAKPAAAPPKEEAAKPATAPAPKEEAAPAAAAAAADRPDWKAHVDAAMAFLKAWGKGNWEDAKAVAGDKVAVKVGDKTYSIDVAGGKSDAKLILPFRGLSSIREDGKMKGVAVNEMTVDAGGAKKTGKGKVMTDETGGAVKVTSIEVE